jgi:hypothetical protein
MSPRGLWRGDNIPGFIEEVKLHIADETLKEIGIFREDWS